jgi:hypothetical protein
MEQQIIDEHYSSLSALITNPSMPSDLCVMQCRAVLDHLDKSLIEYRQAVDTAANLRRMVCEKVAIARQSIEVELSD